MFLNKSFVIQFCGFASSSENPITSFIRFFTSRYLPAFTLWNLYNFIFVHCSNFLLCGIALIVKVKWNFVCKVNEMKLTSNFNIFAYLWAALNLKCFRINFFRAIWMVEIWLRSETTREFYLHFGNRLISQENHLQKYPCGDWKTECAFSLFVSSSAVQLFFSACTDGYFIFLVFSFCTVLLEKNVANSNEMNLSS